MVPTYSSSFCASVASLLWIFQPSSVGVNLVKGQNPAFACFFFSSSVRLFAAAAPPGAQQWSAQGSAYPFEAAFPRVHSSHEQPFARAHFRTSW